MARLCLLLGFLFVVGCRASTTPETNPVVTTDAPNPDKPTDAPSSTAPVPAVPDTVASATTAATTGTSNVIVATTRAAPSNAATTNKIDNPPDPMAPASTGASTIAPQVIQTTVALTGASQSLISSSQQATTATSAATTAKTDAPTKAQTTSQSSVTTTPQNNVVVASTPSTTHAPAKSDYGMTTPAKEESTTGPPQPSTAAQATTTGSSASPNELKTTQPSIVITEPKKTQTPALSSSSESPVSETAPLTPSSKTPESAITPKQTSAITSSVPANTDKSHVVAPVVKYGDNIEVQCINGTGDKLVKIHLKASRICDNTIKHTDDEHQTFMHVCQAVMPGYQQGKDKCTIQLARTDSDEVPVIAAIVETQLSPDDLFAKLKGLKKRDYSTLFSYQSSALEDPDVVSIPLISAIVSLAAALLIIAAIYGCWHQKQTRKREQRLTEELQTMENGYHDNPTLEVMETAPEMQEKKGGPNGELGDSWIVPLDNLTGDELLDEEEDTHL